METLNKLKDDLKAARLARDAFLSDTLRSLIGDVELTLTRPNPENLSVEEITQNILTSFTKNARTFAEQTSDATVKATKASEIEVYKRYMPHMMTFDEVKEIVVKQFSDVLTKEQTGPVQKYLKANYAGKYDGAVAAQVIKALIPQ